MSSPPFAVQSIDHVVLTVASIQATVAFYTKHLGMTHETFVSGDGVER
jgi:catechol 2,3-dioxygenase-like lactoylglutathione lyase family enzyme